MSVNEPDHLEFRGKDVRECEQFIAAVSKHARAEGKLRDDQWMADFVAGCLAEEALIWWSLLDEETQGSWRLLRQAMISGFRPQFYGKSGAEAEDFVHQIRQRALHVGKLKDPHWAVDFASGCFVGSALRWYMSLDSSVRDDWVSLQQAIFCQYSPGFEEDSSAPTIPTPAFAATAPAPTKHQHRGRIRACKKGNSTPFYLSKITETHSGYEGRIQLTSVIGEALEVEYEPASASNGLQTLTIPNDQIKGYNLLGMKWYYADATESHNFLVACSFDSSSGNESILTRFNGPRLTTAWEISSSENEQGVRPVFAMSGPGHRFFTSSGSGVNTALVFTRVKADYEVDVDLFFEPV